MHLFIKKFVFWFKCHWNSFLWLQVYDKPSVALFNIHKTFIRLTNWRSVFFKNCHFMVELIFGSIIHTWSFYVFSKLRWGRYSKHSTLKPKTCLSCTMAVDYLAKQGARTSAVIVMQSYSGIIQLNTMHFNENQLNKFEFNAHLIYEITWNSEWHDYLWKAIYGGVETNPVQLICCILGNMQWKRHRVQRYCVCNGII